MKKKFNFDLRSSNAGDIDIWLDEDTSDILNFFPNFPMVKDLVSPWVVQENHFWLVTNHIPRDIFDTLLGKDLVPFNSYCYTYENMRKSYFNNDPQLW